MSRKLSARWRRNAPTAITLRAEMARTCPRCEAAPGQSCQRWSGGRVRGKDIGGGRYVQMKTTHPERQHNPAAVPAPAPGTEALAAPVDPRSIPWTGRNKRLAGTKMHVIGGCCQATLDTARSVPVADVPPERRCGRTGCRNRWPEAVAA